MSSVRQTLHLILIHRLTMFQVCITCCLGGDRDTSLHGIFVELTFGLMTFDLVISSTFLKKTSYVVFFPCVAVYNNRIFILRDNAKNVFWGFPVSLDL